MYRTAKGEEIFVIDGHTHFWDGSPANQKNIHCLSYEFEPAGRTLAEGKIRKIRRADHVQ
jgi:hypothetical protein